MQLYWTSFLLRRAQEEFNFLCNTFRSLQLLNNRLECLMRDYFYLLKVIVARLANVATFVIIRHYKDLSPIILFVLVSLAASTLLVMISILELFGSSHALSQKCISSWKKIAHYKNFKNLFKNQRSLSL
jgi:hypothetical protein